MFTGWWGYDPARVHALGQRLVAAADELAVLVGNDGEQPEVGAAVWAIVTSLRSEWCPLVNCIVANSAMTAWVSSEISVPMAVPQPPTANAEAVACWWAGLSNSQQHTPSSS